jgi:phospholipid/cholesterol/gamma-HCH transport system ATP-binding protein
VIRLIEVSKKMRGLAVLDRVSLEVPDRQATAILGPSGIGKSVLLRTLAGLLVPDSGTVLYDDRPMRFGLFADNSGLTGGIGYVFQGGALFDSLTVAENVALPLEETLRSDGTQVRSRVSLALETVGMAQNSGLMPAQLSGGMARLVAIARAIVTDPKYYFLDEPTTGLDPAIAERMIELIRRLRDELGRTVVLVTHDLAAARAVADRLFLLRSGRLEPADNVSKEDYAQAYS